MTHTEMLNTLLDAATKARTAQKHFEAATDRATKTRCLKEKKLKEKELDNVLFNLGQLVKVTVPILLFIVCSLLTGCKSSSQRGVVVDKKEASDKYGSIHYTTVVETDAGTIAVCPGTYAYFKYRIGDSVTVTQDCGLGLCDPPVVQ